VTPTGELGIAELAEILVYERPLDGTAQHVVDLALESLAYCDGVGMKLVDREGQSAQRAHATTGTRSSDLDALQEALDEGPCVECLRTGELHLLDPVTADERWPDFAPLARRAGLTACLALPLVARGELIGVLNLYAWPTVGFAGWDRQHCSSFARHASMPLASAQAYGRTQVLLAELRARVSATDDVVHQAHGVLMVTRNTSLDDAIIRLTELARTQGGTIEDAAQSVLDSVA
jgi:GAF domain-containing protein